MRLPVQGKIPFSFLRKVFTVAESSELAHDNIAVISGLLLAHNDEIAIHNAYILHAFALYAKAEYFLRKVHRLERQPSLDIFDRKIGSGGGLRVTYRLAAVFFHQRHLVIANRMAGLRHRRPLSVRPQFPAAGGGIQRRLEDVVQLRGQSGILDLNQHFDAAIEVAVHHVGAADPEFIDGAEIEDPRVLQDIVRESSAR